MHVQQFVYSKGMTVTLKSEFGSTRFLYVQYHLGHLSYQKVTSPARVAVLMRAVYL